MKVKCKEFEGREGVKITRDRMDFLLNFQWALN
jgi:hypothetical protein